MTLGDTFTTTLSSCELGFRLILYACCCVQLQLSADRIWTATFAVRYKVIVMQTGLCTVNVPIAKTRQKLWLVPP